jgi:hypothetical protein
MLNHTHVASRPPTDQASIAATWRPTAPISSKKHETPADRLRAVLQ